MGRCLLLATVFIAAQGCAAKSDRFEEINYPVVRNPLECLLDRDGNPEVISMSETSDGKVHKHYSILGVYARNMLDMEKAIKDLEQKAHEREMFWYEHDKRVAEILKQIVNRLAILEGTDNNCVEQTP